VQAASRENLYNAVDLMEVSVVAGAVVSVAHDDRVPRPLWLTAQFQPTPVRLTVAGQPMTVFQRRAARDESLTLGANAERQAAPANMYVVFIQGR
jgi:beta-galactosidase